MKKADIARLGKEDVIKAIGKEWMLVTAGTPDKFNTMTASWGGVGYLWNKAVAFVFIRPERYTHEFVENNERLTLAFLGNENREILNFCGTKSGRDCNLFIIASLLLYAALEVQPNTFAISAYFMPILTKQQK